MSIHRTAGFLSICSLLLAAPAWGQSYDITFISIPAASFSMGEAEASYQGPPGTYDAPVHTVTLSAFSMSETEVTNEQYVGFLNAALNAALIEVHEETGAGPDKGNILVYGTASAPSQYAGMAIMNLSGTRVMKDHDNGDGDDNPFTGVIEPENPLNLSYIGYDEGRMAGDFFYVKDPQNATDFDWNTLTNYYNYTTTAHENDTSVLLNDYASWSELSDYPNNLPSIDAARNWPASFIRWYGAKAFVLYYGYDLPTEAEWEYAGQGGLGFEYATDNGTITGDGTSANWNYLHQEPSTGHVLDVKTGSPNPFGLYNMAGNVWEWMDDFYDSAFYVDGTDPVNTTDTGKHVRRGGSWNYHQSTLKTAARASDEAFKGNDHFGFRVVSRSSTGTALETSELPRSLLLSQNFPNPFFNSTTIVFETSTAGPLTLKVFNMLGQNVSTLFDGFSSVGRHSRVLSVDGLPNGVYIYRLTSQTGVMSRSMIVWRR